MGGKQSSFFFRDIHFSYRNGGKMLGLRGIKLTPMNATPKPHILLLVLCNKSVKYQCELLLLAKEKGVLQGMVVRVI
jgi:hypothetical protein